MDYKDTIAWMQTFPDMERGTAPTDNLTMTLHSMKSLLARLGNPQLGRKTVHVTGSKGKGSTSTMIASALHCAGEHTALYLSPHLHSYTERIQIDSQFISENEFAAAASCLVGAVEAEHNSGDGPIVTFGILTALFFQLARYTQAHWQVVEVGLGGSEDATNVFAEKQIAVITPVSLEHTAILGSTPAEIAAQKAGIITAGSTAVLAPQHDKEVKLVVEQRCRKVGARLIDVAASCSWEFLEQIGCEQICRIKSQRRDVQLRLPLLGTHQIANAATAVTVADAISDSGCKISDQAVACGLASARLAGRLEVVSQKPVVVVDGAHNGESAGALREALKKHFHFNRCIVVIGVNKDKDIKAILAELAPIADTVVATKSGNKRAMEPARIAEIAAATGVNTFAADTTAHAVEIALSHAAPEDLVCVTGSLYVVAEVRHILLPFLADKPFFVER